jgi:methylmalonyl-CoA mutase cobalamin-binding subunit
MPNELFHSGDMDVPVSLIEKATGLDKTQIRKWEARYGFPAPTRDSNGDRVYPAEQVACLRAIRRLLSAGMRPCKVVGLDVKSLESLLADLSDGQGQCLREDFDDIIEPLTAHDISGFRRKLNERLLIDGLGNFCCITLPNLTSAVGEAWLHGKVRVFEEHIFSEVTQEILNSSIHAIATHANGPRILLTTPPGEIHVLGLLMANAILSMAGACCIRLGAQTPEEEIVAAAESYSVDIVALSFSAAFPKRDGTRFLRKLRDLLAPQIGIWVGGAGTSRIPPMAGVEVFHSLGSVAPVTSGLVRRPA